MIRTTGIFIFLEIVHYYHCAMIFSHLLISHSSQDLNSWIKEAKSSPWLSSVISPVIIAFSTLINYNPREVNNMNRQRLGPPWVWTT